MSSGPMARWIAPGSARSCSQIPRGGSAWRPSPIRAFGSASPGKSRQLTERGFAGIVIFDAAVMIESGNYRNMDRLVVVATDEATQAARLRGRDGIGEAEAARRIASQMPVAEKAKLADHVIDNAGDRSATEAQVRRVHAALFAELEARRHARAR